MSFPGVSLVPVVYRRIVACVLSCIDDLTAYLTSSRCLRWASTLRSSLSRTPSDWSRCVTCARRLRLDHFSGTCSRSFAQVAVPRVGLPHPGLLLSGTHSLLTGGKSHQCSADAFFPLIPTPYFSRRVFVRGFWGFLGATHHISDSVRSSCDAV